MIDIIIICFIGLTAGIAYKRGFIITAYQLVSIILALGIAFLVYPIVAEILKLTPMDQAIQQTMTQYLSGLEVVEGLQSQAEILKEYLSFMPALIQDNIVQNNNPEVYRILGVESVVEYIAAYLTQMAINILAMIITWISVRIGLGIAVSSINLVAKLPVIRFFNKWGGFILGIGKAVAVIWLICLVIPFIIAIPEFVEFKQLWNQSVLGQWFYENNLILDYLSQMILG